MSEIYWLNPVKGLFTDAADWSGGVVPGASDDAILNATGVRYAVTVTSNAAVNSIQLNSNATLAIIQGSLTAPAGTGTGANAGKIVVDSDSKGVGSAYLYIGATFDNSGSVILGDGNGDHQSKLWLESNTTLTGGGTITLSGMGSSIDVEIPSTLTNVDNTISGNGSFGLLPALVNKSQGVIDAKGGSLSLGTGDFTFNLENDGLLEASGSGTLNIYDTVITGAHGIISGAAGGQVVVLDSTVTGQTLSTQAGGLIDVIESTAIVAGPISNAGTLLLESTGVLSLDKSVTLTGGGSVVLGIRSALITANKSATLTNANNIIYGAGSIGGGDLTFVNQAGGIVEAENEGKAYDKRIIIDTARNTIVNAGLMEADTRANLTVMSAVSNTGALAASGGNLIVTGAVTGSGDATITGGTLNFKSSFDEAVTFTDDSGVLKLAQSQSYTAAITGFSVDGGTSLDLRDIDFVDAGEATYSGTQTDGVLMVTDGTRTASINLIGDYTSSTFTASADGRGGVDVVAAGGQMPSAAHFVSAMAAMTGRGLPAGLIDARGVSEGRQMMLAAPRVALA